MTETYDGIMVNTYKGLAFLGSGKKDDARVEFNRVADRQSRAETEFATQKAKLDAEAEEKSQGADLNTAIQNARNSKDYQDMQTELGKYANYQSFINPAASYLRAVYLINNADNASDLEAARVELARVRDMAGASPVVLADMQLIATKAGAVRRNAGKTSGAKTSGINTWIVYENGQAPTFITYRVTFPVPVVGKNGQVSVGLVTVAMPRIVFHPPATNTVLAVAAQTEVQTAPIGNFNYVMASEFQRRQTEIMTRVVVEAVLKAGMQTAAAQTGNGLVQLAALVASNVSTADTRSWTALPGEFQAARVDTPANGHIHLRTGLGQDLGDVDVPPDHPSIIYVKQLVPGARPAIQVFPL